LPRTYKRRCDQCGKDYKGEGRKFCSRECGLNYADALNAARKTETKFTENPDDTATLEGPLSRIRTLDELLDAANVDRTIWEVERYVVNKYEQASKNDDNEPQVTECSRSRRGSSGTSKRRT
jgi:hypothetical protein